MIMAGIEQERRREKNVSEVNGDPRDGTADCPNQLDHMGIDLRVESADQDDVENANLLVCVCSHVYAQASKDLW